MSELEPIPVVEVYRGVGLHDHPELIAGKLLAVAHCDERHCAGQVDGKTDGAGRIARDVTSARAHRFNLGAG